MRYWLTLCTIFFACSIAGQGVAEELELFEVIEAPRVMWGGDLRFRIIHENARKLSSTESGSDRLWQRYRARVWASAELAPGIQLNVRMVAEPRHFSHPDSYEEWVREEALFDRLNVTFSNCFDLPLELVIGRQQIEFADRWLIGEGTPRDGTRSDFFDAIRSRWEFERQGTTVDLIWIENHRNSSAWLPVIHDIDFDNTSQDERGVIAWVSQEVADEKFADGYFIYKKDFNPDDGDGAEGETCTFGLRAHGQSGDCWTYNAEIAPQFGRKNGNDYTAFAANNWLEYLFSETYDASVRLGYEYLSGDNNPDEHFDKLWGREGLWSDLYTGGIDGFDGRELDSSNLHRPHIILQCRPVETIRLKAEYSLLFADEYVDGVDPEKVDNGSKFKGHYIKASIEQQLTESIKHYATVQAMVPGSYYSDDREDTASWARYAIEYKF